MLPAAGNLARMSSDARESVLKPVLLALLGATALLGARPLQAGEWREVRYACGAAGEVQAQFSQSNSKLAVLTVAGHRWTGSLDGGSLQVFTPDQRSANSPWMSFYKDSVSLYRGKSWSLADPASEKGMISCHVKAGS